MAAREVEPVVVLGLGRFGRSVALALTREGCEVLAIDQEMFAGKGSESRSSTSIESRSFWSRLYWYWPRSKPQ